MLWDRQHILCTDLKASDIKSPFLWRRMGDDAVDQSQNGPLKVSYNTYSLTLKP